MTERVEVAIIGAGPAGLAAADVLGSAGVRAVLLDEQSGPGGQIYRGIAGAGAKTREILGPDYAKGATLLGALDRPGVDYRPGAMVWQVTEDRAVQFTRGGTGAALSAEAVLVATGAIERPMPFEGWTLPGVMTAGAGQILLKTSGLVAREPAVLAGSGPLLYLFAVQVLRAGGHIAALLETTPPGLLRGALRHLPGFARMPAYGLKGLGLLRDLRRSGVRHVRHVDGLAASGDGRLTTVRYRKDGAWEEIAARTLFVHQGVVPNVQITRALRLDHAWDALQRCWRPVTDGSGRTSVDGIFVAGDGGGISGADAAALQGRIAGWAILDRLGKAARAESDEKDVRGELRRHLGARPFIDALYAPNPRFVVPDDATTVCRCEEVTAGDIRRFVKLGCLGPNQTKAFGRPGMGPCQGRFCGLTVAEVIAEARGVPVDEVGYYRIRPPIKPITLGEAADTASPDTVL